MPDLNETIQQTDSQNTVTDAQLKEWIRKMRANSAEGSADPVSYLVNQCSQGLDNPEEMQAFLNSEGGQILVNLVENELKSAVINEEDQEFEASEAARAHDRMKALLLLYVVNEQAEAKSETTAEYLKEQTDHLLKNRPKEDRLALAEKESEALGAYIGYLDVLNDELHEEQEKVLLEEKDGTDTSSPKEEQLTLRPDTGLKVVSQDGKSYLIDRNAKLQDLSNSAKKAANQNYNTNYDKMIQNQVDPTKVAGLGQEANALTLSSVDDRASSIQAQMAIIDNQKTQVQSAQSYLMNQVPGLGVPAGSNVNIPSMPSNVSFNRTPAASAAGAAAENVNNTTPQLSPLPNTPGPQQAWRNRIAQDNKEFTRKYNVKEAGVDEVLNTRRENLEEEQNIKKENKEEHVQNVNAANKENTDNKENVQNPEENIKTETAPRPDSIVPTPYDKFK